MSRLLYKNILTIIGVLVIAGFVFYQWQGRLDGPKLRVLGWDFVAADTTWQTVAGYHVVDLTLHPVSGRGRFEFNNHGLKSLCRAVVDNQPDTPDDAIESSDIIKVMITIPGKYLGEDRDDIFVEIPVREGKCPNLNSVGNYDVFLPFPLHEWRAEKYKLYDDDGEARIAVEFSWKGEGDAPFNDFDYKLACQLVIGAPYAGMTSALNDLENPQIEIQAIQVYGISIANYFVSHAQRFDTVGNACIEHGEEFEL